MPTLRNWKQYFFLKNNVVHGTIVVFLSWQIPCQSSYDPAPSYKCKNSANTNKLGVVGLHIDTSWNGDSVSPLPNSAGRSSINRSPSLSNVWMENEVCHTSTQTRESEEALPRIECGMPFWHSSVFINFPGTSRHLHQNTISENYWNGGSHLALACSMLSEPHRVLP